MKKLIIFLCVIALFIPVLCISTSAAGAITIWKTATAPKIDCVLDEGYQLIADSKKNATLFEITNKQNVKNHVEIYACWDNDYLYLYVKADCNDPHIAYQEGNHYIFNAHYLMTALCPDDSTQEKYKGTNDSKGGWDWSTLYGKNYLYEWTTIFDSKAKEKKIADHFGALSSKTGFEYATKSEKGYDIYEQKIPMKMLTTSVMSSGMKPAKGTVFGLGASVGFVDVGEDYKEDQQVNTNLSKYFDGKNLNALQLCKLDSKLNENEESSAVSSNVSSQVTSSSTASNTSSAVVSSTSASTSSKTESSKPAASVASNAESDTSGSGDFEYWWLIISGVAVVIAAIAVVLIVRKRKK